MRLTRTTDERLVRRAAQGEESAFAEIFDRYGQDLYRYCRAVLGDPDDAHDALQNTMVSVLRALPGEDRSILLKPWLFRIARNESLSLIRTRGNSVVFEPETMPPEPGADVEASRREELRELMADLASLPEGQRSALLLHEMSGLSHDEVAVALHKSPRASRQAVYEARLALQDLKAGRSLDCDVVRSAISDGDGRVLRGRKMRSHLRTCARCSDFQLAIRKRPEQLRALAPPLPAAAATGLIASVLGGTAVQGGIAGTGAVGAASIPTVAKTVAVVGASLAVGAGGAGLAGVSLPSFGSADQTVVNEDHASGSGLVSAERGEQPNTTNRAPGRRGRSPVSKDGKGSGKRENRGNGDDHDAKGQSKGAPNGNAGGASADHAASNGAAGGSSDAAQSGSGRTETIPPGQSVAEDRSSGHSASPMTGPPEHAHGQPGNSNAGGNSGSHGKPGG